MVGGFTERDQDAGPTAEAYNPKTNQWRLISPMKISMELYDSAVLDNKFFVVNSSSENLVGLVYDPKVDEWVYMAHGLNTGDFVPKNRSFMIATDLRFFVCCIDHISCTHFNNITDHNGYIVYVTKKIVSIEITRTFYFFWAATLFWAIRKFRTSLRSGVRTE